MPTIATTDQPEGLLADHAGVLNLEREGQQTLRFIVVQALNANGTAIYHSTTAVPSDVLDDLQMAIWADAEWQ